MRKKTCDINWSFFYLNIRSDYINIVVSDKIFLSNIIYKKRGFTMETIPNTESIYPTELCWQTGVFTDDCECEFCDHKGECSGYEEDDE